MPRGALLTLSMSLALGLIAAPALPAAPDHFMLYTVTPTKGSAKPVPFAPVTLTDQFRAADYTVTKPFALGLPANKNGGGVQDQTTHLVEYQLKPVRGVDKFAKRAGVIITNQCNDLRVELTAPVSILVPASKGLAGPLPAPDPQSHNLDHFLCYAAKPQRKLGDGTNLPPFPKAIQVDVVDQFHTQTRRYDLTKITKLCAPVDKSGAPVFVAGSLKGTPAPIAPAVIRNPADHLVCYQAKLASRIVPQNGCGAIDPSDRGTKIAPPQQAHVRQGTFVTSQFGSVQLDATKEIELCIPSLKTVPTPTPTLTRTPAQTPSVGGTPTPTATRSPTPTLGTTPTPTVTFTPSGGLPPVAVNDSYDAVGNTPVKVGVAPDGTPAVQLAGSVLDNDPNPENDVTVTGVSDVTTGATVNMNPNGTFRYLPPVGFTGLDTFTYTLEDPSAAVTATVTIALAKRVWYVDDTAAGPTFDGRATSPFATLHDAQIASGTGDIIFVFPGTYPGGIPLQTGQSLFGDDLVVDTKAIVTDTGRAVLTNAAGNAITLGQNNTIRGLNVGDTLNGYAIFGLNVAGTNLSDVAVNGAGGALNLQNADGLFTFDSISRLSDTGPPLSLVNTSGAITVTNTTTLETTGVSDVEVTDSAARITLNVLNADAFGASAIKAKNLTQTFKIGGGLINVSSAISDSLTADNAPLDWTFTKFSANGGPRGISLTDTTGAITVTGIGTPGSGGTIQNTTSDGIALNHAGSVDLKSMTIANAGTTANKSGVTALNTNLRIRDSTIASPAGTGISAAYDSGVANTLVISATAVSNAGRLGTSSAIAVVDAGSAVLTATIESNDVTAGAQSDLGIFVDVQDTGIFTSTLRLNTLHAGGATGTGGIQAQSIGTGTLAYHVISNTIANTKGPGFFGINAEDATATGTIVGNTITGAASNQSGLIVENASNKDLNVLVDANGVFSMGLDGMRIFNLGTGTGRLDATVTRNTVGAATSSSHGIRVESFGTGATLCIDPRDNHPTGVGFTDIGIAKNAGTLLVHGFGSGDLASYVSANNFGASAQMFGSPSGGICKSPPAPPPP